MTKITISKALIMLHECFDFSEWMKETQKGFKSFDELKRVLQKCARHQVNLKLLATAMHKQVEADKDWTRLELALVRAAFSLHGITFHRGVIDP